MKVLAVFISVFLVCSACSVAVFAEDPVVDDSNTSRKLEEFRDKNGGGHGEKKVVTIYDFRSTVPEITAGGATDMFTTALIKTGAFAVAERKRLNEGVMLEKQLNSQGLTAGNTAEQKLAGAEYIFEGAVTEANSDASDTGVSGTIRGLGAETSGSKAMIGLDVRVIDARTGVVVDAVNVRKAVKQGGFSVAGIGAFAQSFFKKTDLQGADLNVNHSSKEGVDQALRECIETAILELVKRYSR